MRGTWGASDRPAPNADWHFACDGTKVLRVGPEGRVEVDQPWARGLARERIDEGLLRLIDDHHPRHPSLAALYEYRDVGGVRFCHLRVQRAFAKLAPPHVFGADEIKVNEPSPEGLSRRPSYLFSSQRLSHSPPHAWRSPQAVPDTADS